ncbi:hypothetical protein N7471_000226 [Penicillium samsonianum]|uniref:uncharacterized protein n=1 Tax=Penicillium samsonianum TaxID=1882272 RepID=UPI002547A636|nr:uncharacterized protein N7471_000226 [Penicillium samsonianum]KAJ6149027.1 hypothetical protein N7471_000226 [Penicillium samsonianum]
MNDSGIKLVQFTQVRDWIDGRYSWACRFFFHVPYVDDNGKNTHGPCANNQPYCFCVVFFAVRSLASIQWQTLPAPQAFCFYQKHFTNQAPQESQNDSRILFQKCCSSNSVSFDNTFDCFTLWVYQANSTLTPIAKMTDSLKLSA